MILPAPKEGGRQVRWSFASPPSGAQKAAQPADGGARKSDFVHHHHHPEGLVYRGFCFNSSTSAVSKVTSRMWRSVESLFPGSLALARAADGPDWADAQGAASLRSLRSEA